MKPDFALSLSFEGIALLHRAADGWRSLGDVSLEEPDLTSALADLRARALAIAPDGLWCKVIIPNDQIRYISIETGPFESDARQAMIEAALDGATPYAIHELAYDFCADGEMTHVAAVALETLHEAKAFAQEHAFTPVSFAAIPGENRFVGEPFFGTAGSAEALNGEPVERDETAITVLGPVLPPETAPTPEPAETGALQGRDSAGDVTDTQDTDGAASSAENNEPANEPPAGDPAEAPVAGFSSRRKRGPRALDGARRDDIPPSPVTPLAAAEPEHGEAKVVPEIEPAEEPVGVADPVLDIPLSETPEDEPAQGSGGVGGFLSRRKPGPQPVPPMPAASPAAIPVAEPDQAITFKDTSTSGGAADPGLNETERMTVFGARESQKIGGKPRFLGLILTVVLLIFLAGVAAWASIFLEGGLSGLFHRDTPPSPQIVRPEPQPEEDATDPVKAATPPAVQTAPQTPPPADPPLLGALPPSIPPSAPDIGTADVTRRQPEIVTEAPSATGLSDTDRAVLEALRTPPRTVSQPQSEDVALAMVPDAGDPEAEADEALAAPDFADLNDEARYAATGIWPNAPTRPETPPVIGLHDLYVASIDRTDLSQDAVALPGSPEFETDDMPASISSPAAAGTAFALDDRGLVAPSAEGTVTPDGITVYLGRPAVVPPPTPTRFETQPDVDLLQQRLAGYRPKLRPGGLVELNERAQLGGLSRAELSGKRPKLRPKSLKDKAEEDDTPTAQAVVVSRMPKPRPKDLAAKVETARATAPSGNLGSAAGVATAAPVAPATVTPRIPSSASVARQATMDNAINLKRVNLIGVYGSPSNRRALVRLPSGRYKKVKVGDTVDGGRVIAIGDSELRYQKSGRNMTLKIPSG